MDRRIFMKNATLSTVGLVGLGGLSLEQLHGRDLINPQITRLLFNENPYGPSSRVLERLSEVQSRSNRYASFYQYDFLKLKQLIAQQEGVEPNQILLGHGSIQPLRWLAMMFGGPRSEFVVPTPAFDVVGSYGRVIGTSIKAIPGDQNLKTNLTAMRQAVGEATKMVVVVNPNNPTGTVVDTNELKAFCKSLPGSCMVSVDEAYIHYLGDKWRSHSMVSLVSEHPNILVTRTFSKIYGMAGLRIGFMIADAQIVAQVEREMMMGFPGNMPNTLSVAAAMAALEDEGFLKDSRNKNDQMKIEIYSQLNQKGWQYIKSDTNFVYFNTPDFPKFKELMNSNGVLLAGGWPTKANWGRVTVGNQREIEVFFKLLAKA